MKRIHYLLAGLMAFGGTASLAQMTPQQASQMQQQQNAQQWQLWGQLQQQQNMRERNAAAQAEADRQWWEEENRIQAEISRLRNTPFYGAVAYDVNGKKYNGEGGYITKELAIKNALKSCGASSCKIIATYANTCLMVAAPEDQPGNINAFIVATDKDGRTAIEKAFYSCEAKYGKDRCIFFGRGQQKPFCSGYDYGFYDQK